MTTLKDTFAKADAATKDLGQDALRDLKAQAVDAAGQASDAYDDLREAAYTAELNACQAVGPAITCHPYADAGVALAIGTAIGLALPRTRTKDRVLRPERDRLLAEERNRAAATFRFRCCP